MDIDLKHLDRVLKSHKDRCAEFTYFIWLAKNRPKRKELMFFPVPPKGWTFPPIAKPDFVKKVGQVWEYRASTDDKWDVPDANVGKYDALTISRCAVKIVEIEDGGIYAEVIKNTKYSDIAIGDTIRFRKNDFEKKENDFLRLIMNNLPGPQTCKSCKRIYEYANGPNQIDGTFKCWGCRHGY